MPEPWVLAVDLGSGGLKVGAVSLDGRMLAHSQSALETRFLAGGGAEQDPEAWWKAVGAGARDVLAVVDPGDLIGVGITGQWGSLVPVAADGAAAGPCLMWSDTRGARYSAKALGGPISVLGYAPGKLIRWIRVTGGAPSPHGADPLSHELYLRHAEPEVYAKARHLLEPLDYLGLRFTGRIAATPGSMVLSWLTDNRRGAPPAYVRELIRRSGRDGDRLPELLPTGTVLGDVTPEVASLLGIPRVPVVAGVPDVHAAFLGSGAVQPFQAHVTISSTCWICCEVPFKKTDALHQMASVPGLRPGRYVVINNQETAGLCLNWIQGLLGGCAYEELTALAATAPPGSDGVMFTPWLNGERTPIEDRNLRGAFINLSLRSGQAHMVRSVLEGVAFNARWMLEAMEKFTGRRLDTLRIQGGGAQSDLWCQVYADVLDRPMERTADPVLHSLRGAGLFAAVSLGKIAIDDVANMIAVTRTFKPSAEARHTYDAMYREFKGLYGRLRGTYSRLNAGAVAS